MGGCASKDKKDKVVDGDAAATDNATENNTADGDKAAANANATTEANGDATTNAEGCVFQTILWIFFQH